MMETAQPAPGAGLRAPLVRLDGAIEEALERGALLTPNQRLAREIAYAVDFQGMRAGGGWPTPDVLSLNAFLARSYAEARDAGVSGAEATLLADDLVPLAMAAAAPDADWLPHVDSFAEAWRIAHLHGIRSADPQLQTTENGRVYARWAQAFEADAARRGWLTAAELPDRLVRLMDGAERWKPRPAKVLESNELSPAARRFITANRYQTLAATNGRPPAATRLLHIVRETEELATAALWARERLAAQGDARIGIIVPRLGAEFPAVARRVQALFADVTNPASYVNVSGGVILAAEPVCRDALEFLDFAASGADHDGLRALMRSPFLDPGLPKQLLLNGYLPERADLRAVAARGDASPKLARLAEVVEASGATRQWAPAMGRLLTLAGWAAQGLDSREMQARRLFENCLDALAVAEHAVGGSDWPTAVARLRHLAERRLFAPQATHAPIQILGRAESLGLEFDHLWLAGLNRGDWPSVPEPNPLLPLAVQRAAKVPRLFLDHELSHARALTEAWRHAAKYLVASFAGEDEDASRLVEDFAPAAVGEIVAAPELAANGHPWAMARGTTLESYRDESAGPSPLDNPRGGSAILRDQSQCPFRAWANHRLRLRDRGPSDRFPNAAERGTVVHEVLGELGHRYTTSAAMTEIDGDAIHAVVQQIVSQQSHWPAPYRHREAKRLEALVGEWLELEDARQPFAIEAIEELVEVTIGGLRLNLRVDRIDALDIGGRLLIDFKTGKVNTGIWRGPRPEDPQLPLYAVALAQSPPSIGPEQELETAPDASHPVNGIALAQVRPGEVKLVGIADAALAAVKLIDTKPAGATPAGATPVGTTPAGIKPARAKLSSAESYASKSFTELVDDWRDELTGLAEDFLAGAAAVDPAKPQVCNFCHLHALCRIFDER